MIFKFTRKEVYGRPLYFPDCELSKRLLEGFPHANMARKTYTEKQIKILKEIGIIIQVNV